MVYVFTLLWRVRCHESVDFLQIIQRGVAPTGGGIVNFRCPCRYKLCPLQMVDSGKVKKVRGIAYVVPCFRFFMFHV